MPREPRQSRRVSIVAPESRKQNLERPRGLEPPPTAWQAVVLPLYYGRKTCGERTSLL
jgi:hypothetical protein